MKRLQSKPQTYLLQIPKGTIKDFEFTQSSKGATVNQDQDSKILSAVLNVAVKLQGKGKILEATINSSGVSLDQASNQMKMGINVTKDTTLQIGGLNKNVSSMANSKVLSPAIMRGKNLRILEGAVTTTDNDYTNETITWDNIRSLTRATFADKPNEEFITLPVGSVIKFNVNYGGEDAYFIKKSLANVEAFEESVADGTGLKLSIPEDGTDQTYEFDTANFLPGDYVIRVMDPYILSVHLTTK